MQWYYQSEGQSLGPIDEDEFRRLTRSGEITDETLVWTDGMTAWAPYSSVGAKPQDGAAFGEPDPDQQRATCSQCGRSYAVNQTLTVRGSVVCASCKPLFLQQLKEGIAVTETVEYGGFWIRGLARIVDSIVLWVVNVILMIPLMGLMSIAVPFDESGDPSATGCILMAAIWILQLGVMAAYEIVFLKLKGATPGKMICRVKVIQSDGKDLSWGRAVGRFFGNMLTGMTFFIGYILAAFDSEKRALHDMLCNTRVVKVS